MIHVLRWTYNDIHPSRQRDIFDIDSLSFYRIQDIGILNRPKGA